MAYIRRTGRDDRELEASSGAAEGIPITAGGSAAGAGGENAYTKSNFVSGKAVLDRNKTQAAPDFGADIRSRLAQDDAAAKGAFADYDKGAAATTGKASLDDNTIKAGVRNDAPAFARIQGVLSNPEKIQDWQSYKPNVSVSDVNALNTGAGIQDAYARQQQQQGNFGYTQGQAALDSTLFGKDPRARQQVQGLLADRQRVYGDAEARVGEASKIRDDGNAEIDKRVGEARDKLGVMGASLSSRAEAAAKNYTLTPQQKAEIAKGMDPQLQNTLQAFLAAPDKYVDKDLVGRVNNPSGVKQGAADYVRDQYGKSMPLSGRVGHLGTKLDDYSHQDWNPDDVQKRFMEKYEASYGKGPGILGRIKPGGYENPLYSEEQAGQFNRIHELLGDKSRVTAGGNRGADTLDVEGLSQELGRMYKGSADKSIEQYNADFMEGFKNYTGPNPGRAPNKSPSIDQAIEDVKKSGGKIATAGKEEGAKVAAAPGKSKAGGGPALKTPTVKELAESKRAKELKERLKREAQEAQDRARGLVTDPVGTVGGAVASAGGRIRGAFGND